MISLGKRRSAQVVALVLGATFIVSGTAGADT